MERGDSSRSIKIHIAEHIPKDIVEDILSRLPVESLLKFRCVSKSWHSLIDSEEFIKIHLKKSRDLSHHRIILNPNRSSDRLLMMCSWRSLLEEPIANPFEPDDVKYNGRKINLVGCCSGLVCLVEDKRRFILWNPSTRMHLNLTEARRLSIMVSGGGEFPMYGFGYDESSDDYKVFTIFISNYPLRPPCARVYSLKSRSWDTLVADESGFRPRHKAGKFVSGNLHWFGDNDEDSWIVSFDFKNEAFGVVGLPDGLDGVETLGVIDGRLSVLCEYEDYSQVWVMKEYGGKESWVNLFTLSNSPHPDLRIRGVSSFCKGPNDDILLIRHSSLVIYSYYPNDKVFHFLHEIYISGVRKVGKVMEEGAFIESLVSLGPYAEQESDAEEESDAS